MTGEELAAASRCTPFEFVPNLLAVLALQLLVMSCEPPINELSTLQRLFFLKKEIYLCKHEKKIAGL